MIKPFELLKLPVNGNRGKGIDLMLLDDISGSNSLSACASLEHLPNLKEIIYKSSSYKELYFRPHAVETACVIASSRFGIAPRSKVYCFPAPRLISHLMENPFILQNILTNLDAGDLDPSISWCDEILKDNKMFSENFKNLPDSVRIISSSTTNGEFTGKEFFERALRKNRIFVMAIGNESIPLTCVEGKKLIVKALQKLEPTLKKRIILVGNLLDETTLSPASTFPGNDIEEFQKMTVCAPGENIPTFTIKKEKSGNYVEKTCKRSGTSFATPLVAGGIASFISDHPGFESDVVVDLLKKSCTPLGDPKYFGHGRVNFEEMYRLAAENQAASSASASSMPLN